MSAPTVAGLDSPTAGKARPPMLKLPVASLGAAALALATALLIGPGGSWIPSLVLLAISVGLALAEVLRRAAVAVRAGAGRLVALTALGLLVLATGSIVVGSLLTYVFGWVALFGVLGGGLVATAAAALQRDGKSPWQAIGAARGDDARAHREVLVRLLAGVWLLLVAAYLALQGLDDAWRAHSLRLVVLLALVGVVGGVATGVFLWRRLGQGTAGTRRVVSATARDEQAVAAHLHDSVLQTLSLIQRNASDPARVAQLARQQERSLRAWLAGRDDAQGDTLAGAVRLIAQEVEDEQPGAVIEVVAVGDARLDREADAMVRAAREAMRNAVRHAGSPVRVFVEVEDGVRELFVRDTGPGFDLGAVADERRGVRDAIIGRMEHVGGSATIDSTASGTEIALKLPAPSGGGSR